MLRTLGVIRWTFAVGTRRCCASFLSLHDPPVMECKEKDDYSRRKKRAKAPETQCGRSGKVVPRRRRPHTTQEIQNDGLSFSSRRKRLPAHSSRMRRTTYCLSRCLQIRRARSEKRSRFADIRSRDVAKCEMKSGTRMVFVPLTTQDRSTVLPRPKIPPWQVFHSREYDEVVETVRTEPAWLTFWTRLRSVSRWTYAATYPRSCVTAQRCLSWRSVTGRCGPSCCSPLRGLRCTPCSCRFGFSHGRVFRHFEVRKLDEAPHPNCLPMTIASHSPNGQRTAPAALVYVAPLSLAALQGHIRRSDMLRRDLHTEEGVLLADEVSERADNYAIGAEHASARADRTLSHDLLTLSHYRDRPDAGRRASASTNIRARRAQALLANCVKIPVSSITGEV